MPPPRDLFGNFDRMRRQIDELFGDVLERTGMTGRGAGFWPSVDVYYCGKPPQAVVTAELAGVDPASLGLEVRGREVVIWGERRPPQAEGRVYQQLEIEPGPFRRTIALGAEVSADDVSATYENGLLRVELPLARAEAESRRVPIRRAAEQSK